MITAREADVLVTRGTLTQFDPATEKSDGSNCQTRVLEDQSVLMHWNDVGTMLVSAGSRITIDSAQGADEGLLRVVLLGAGIAILLHQRGFLVLHGSAVAINEKAALFVGPKGYGKSTIAGSLYARCHGLLTDDVIAVDTSEPGRPLVVPAFPQLKLWPDAAQALGQAPDKLPRLSEQFEKRDMRPVGEFPKTSLPLSAVYTLGLGECVRAIRYDQQRSMFEILINSYLTRFGKQVARLRQTEQFRQCADLAGSVPVFRFERENSLDRIGEAAAFIETHISRLE